MCTKQVTGEGSPWAKLPVRVTQTCSVSVASLRVSATPPFTNSSGMFWRNPVNSSLRWAPGTWTLPGLTVILMQAILVHSSVNTVLRKMVLNAENGAFISHSSYCFILRAFLPTVLSGQSCCPRRGVFLWSLGSLHLGITPCPSSHLHFSTWTMPGISFPYHRSTWDFLFHTQEN